MKDQVMTINSVQKSSKSELSSRFFGRLKFDKKKRSSHHFFDVIVIKFQISIGQGWGRTARRTDGSAGPSPGQLKFEI